MSDTAPAKNRRLHAVVRGSVQGVGFRATTFDQARRLGLAGWVRNCLDGTVEVLAEGAEPKLNLFLAYLRPVHSGPGWWACSRTGQKPRAHRFRSRSSARSSYGSSENSG